MSYIDRAFEQVFTHIYSFVCYVYISSRQIYFIVKLELNKVKQNSDHGCFLWWSVFVWFMICQFSICKHKWNCIGLCCSIYCREGFSPLVYNGILPRGPMPPAPLECRGEPWCIFSKSTASVARKSCNAVCSIFVQSSMLLVAASEWVCPNN